MFVGASFIDSYLQSEQSNIKLWQIDLLNVAENVHGTTNQVIYLVYLCKVSGM